jgi:hypothetical protein
MRVLETYILKTSLLLFCLISGLAYGQAGAPELVEELKSRDCSLAPVVAEDLTDLYKIPCNDERDQDKYCACLDQQKNKNIFLKGMYTEGENLEAHREKIRAQYTDKLLNIYTQMNYGAEYQKKLFGMTHAPDDMVGCTAKDISRNFKEAVKQHHASQASSGFDVKKNSAEQDSNKCPQGDGHCLRTRISEAYESVKSQRIESEKLGGNACQKLAQTTNIFSDGSYGWKQSSDSRSISLSGSTKEEPSKALVPESEESLAEKVKALGQLKDFIKKYNNEKINLFDDEFLNRIGQLEASLKAKKSQNPCSPDSYEVLVDEFKFMRDSLSSYDKTLSFNDSIMTALDMATYNPISKNIENLNKTTLDELSKNFDKVIPNACVTYGDFKILEAQPSDNLISALTSKGPEELVDFLSPQKSVQSSLDQEKNHFLKKNPNIAQLIGTKESRKDLALSLKNFAINSKGLSGPEKIKNFLEFMQNDVTALQNKHALGQVHQCNMLGQNLAAVYVTDGLPNLDFEMKGNQDINVITLLSQNVLSCKIKKEQDLKPTSIEETLFSNPLFVLNGADKVTDQLGPDKDLAYHEFLKKECQGWDEHRERYIKGFCTMAIHKGKKCLESFDSVSETDRMRRRFLKDTELAKKLDSIYELGAGKITPEDREVVAAIVDEKKQNTTVKSTYHNEIAPKLKGPILAKKGEGESFKIHKEVVFEEVRRKQPELTSPAAPLVSQVRPAWVNEESPQKIEPKKFPASISSVADISPEAIRAAPSARSFIASPAEGPDGRLREIQEVQAELKGKTDEMLAAVNAQEKEDLKNKIKSLNDELEVMKVSAREEVKDKNKTVKERTLNSSDPARFLPEGKNEVVSAPALAAPSGRAGSIPHSATLVPKKEASSSAAYNSALLAKYPGQGLEEPTRNIASAPSDMKIIVQTQAIKDHEAGLNRQLVTELQLEKNQFDKIMTGSPQDLASYLQQEFKNRPIPDSGIISLKAIHSKQEFLISVKHDPKMGFIFRPLEKSVRVERKTEYKHLIHTIKNL